MLIEFRAADRVLAFKALGIYVKGIDAAKAACDKVYADTMALQADETGASNATRWLSEMDEMEPGEARDVEVPHETAQTLRLATSVYLTQLAKLAEKETDMLVPLDNTNEIMSQLRSFADRLTGQTEIAEAFSNGMREAFNAAAPSSDDDLSATISFNGGPEIPMQQFERGVKAMSKRSR